MDARMIHVLTKVGNSVKIGGCFFMIFFFRHLSAGDSFSVSWVKQKQK